MKEQIIFSVYYPNTNVAMAAVQELVDAGFKTIYRLK
jgi:hypothetical protein